MPNLESLKKVFEDLLWQQHDRMANPEAAHKAIDALHQDTILKPASPLPDHSWMGKTLPGVVGGGIAGAVLGAPDNSDATMLPSVRQAYNAARQSSLMTLFHKGFYLNDLLSQGIKDPATYGALKEGHKPMGFYMTDNLPKIPGHVSGEYNNTQDTKELRNYLGGNYSTASSPESVGKNRYRTEDPNQIVRATIDPNTRIAEMDEDALRAYKVKWALEYAKEHPEMTFSSNPEYSGHKDMQRAYTEHWKQLADMLKVSKVDEQPDVSEYILLNPDKASLFWENKTWNAKEGGKFHGPRQVLPQFDTTRRSRFSDVMPEEINPKFAAGAIATALGLGAYGASSDNAEAMPLGKLTKQTLSMATKLLDNPRSEDSYYNLIGKTFRDQEIVDVRKNPKNDWRYVVTQDADGNRHQIPMTKDYLNVLNGAHGTQDYLNQFEGYGQTGKMYQALRSLTKREAQRENGPIPSDRIKDFKVFNKGQAQKAYEMDPSLLNDYVYVRTDPKAPILYMPRPYAEVLQRKGHLSIVGEGPKFK